MKILILHQLPYRKADYARALDHMRHDVTYAGHADRLADLPADLPCRRVEIPQDEDIADGVIARVPRAAGYDRVISLSEFGVLAVCRVREHLGIEGASLEQVRRVHDKIRMKEALAGSGVRYPRYATAERTGTPLPWSGRTVLKPRQGTCSEGVRIHDTVQAAVRRLRDMPAADAYELEEYVEGDILHADALVVEGQPNHCVVSKYVNRPVDFAAGMPLGSYQVPYSERHMAFVSRVVRSLGIVSGAVHLEFFEAPDGDLIFLEIANRMGGAGVITAHFRHTGVHLPTYEIAQCLGEQAPPPAPRSGRQHGWLVVPGHHGPPFVRIPDRLLDHPCVDRIHRLDAGATVSGRITYTEGLVPLALEVSHPDAEALAAFLRECANAVLPMQEVTV